MAHLGRNAKATISVPLTRIPYLDPAHSAEAPFFASLGRRAENRFENREAIMSDETGDRLGRRSFLNRVALTAGAARLAPALAAAPAPAALAAGPATAAETAAPKGESGYTPKLAAYAAALRYEEIPADVRQRIKDCITDT